MKSSNKGFSLVEMAIVLVIFGLVIASASSVLTLFANKGGVMKTRKMIEANKESLLSIAAQNGHFIKSDMAGFANSDDIISKMNYPLDSYGRDFHLIIDDSVNYYSGNPSKLDLDYNPICGTDSTSLELHLCNDMLNGCNSSSEYRVVDDIAVVIVSGAENKNVQTDVDNGVVKVWYQGTASVDGYAGDVNRRESYDDIVDWVSLAQLRSEVGCPPLKLDIEDLALPPMKVGSDYSFDIYPKGGIPFRQSASNSDVAEYEWEIVDDDDIVDKDVNLQVVTREDGSDSEAVDDGHGVERGIYLRVRTNSSTIDKSSYRIKIRLTDDSSEVSGGDDNSIERVITIRRMP